MNDPLRGCPVCGTKVEDADLGLRDFRWLDDALPGRVAPTDIDFVLEKNGRVLIQEYKPPGGPVRMGQRLTFKNFIRKMDADVWVVEYDGEKVTAGTMDRDGGVKFKQRKMSVNRLRANTVEWYEAAEGDVA